MAIDAKIKEIAKELHELSDEEAAKASHEALSAIAEAMKNSAVIFQAKVKEYNENVLNNLSKKIKDNKDIRNSLKSQGKVGKDILSSNEKYIKTREEISEILHSNKVKEIFAIAEEFQNDLNILLGQEVQLIYVYENDIGEPEMYVIKDTDLLMADQQSRGSGVAGRFNASVFKNAINDLKQNDINKHIEKMVKTQEPKYNEEGAKKTYMESMRRYRYSRTKQLRFIMWKGQADEWHKWFVSAEGDINEAYAAVVLLNKPIPGFVWSNIDWNVGDFVQRYIADVDSASGLLEGDITVGNIEYAIKSADASMLGVKQMEKLAKNIVDGEVRSLQDLRNYKKVLHDKGKKRNKEIEFVDNSIGKLIKEFENYKEWK